DNEDVRRFDDQGNEIGKAFTREGVGFAGIERPLAPGWDLALGAQGRIWHEPGLSASTLGGEARVTGATRQRGRVAQAEVEGAGGGTGSEAAKFPGGGWTAGVRAELGADTPVGTVGFEYGVALHGRNAVFVRLGRWF